MSIYLIFAYASKVSNADLDIKTSNLLSVIYTYLKMLNTCIYMCYMLYKNIWTKICDICK